MTTYKENTSVAKSDGPLIAALLSMGIGVVVYGVFVILAEVSASFKTFETLNAAVGALSGKTTYAVIVWLVVWFLMHRMVPKMSMNLDKAWKVTMILVVTGIVFTFPIFFQAFAKG